MAEITVNGYRIHYETYGDVGEPLVILNGIMMSTASWKPFIADFSRNNRLILVDFLDQGQSQRMQTAYDHSLQVEVLHGVIRHLGYDRVCIMGISYGGEVAIQYALAYPQFVRRLVLCNTCGRTSPWLKKIGDGWNEVAKTGQGYAYYLTTIPVIYSTAFFEEHADWMEGREAFLTEYFSKPEVLQALIRLTDSSVGYNVVDRLHEIQCPTLILSSSEDVLVPPTEQQLLHRHIAGSVYLTLNGSGHASMYENPAAFAALVLGFANLRDEGIQI
jgi:pimeloyl-ACP methyl ester carboxylesterase